MYVSWSLHIKVVFFRTVRDERYNRHVTRGGAQGNGKGHKRSEVTPPKWSFHSLALNTSPCSFNIFDFHISASDLRPRDLVRATVNLTAIMDDPDAERRCDL